MFTEDDDVEAYTSLPVAVSSWVLESIGFTEMVNGMVRWDPKQCEMTPGDAAKALILALSMGAERPAVENLAKRFEDEPLQLYFGSITDRKDLDPDTLARNLTRIHIAGEERLFMNTSAAMRAQFGIKSRAIHSDTTSVSVYGKYDVYDADGNGYVIDADGNRVPEPRALYITRGYSKDHRPDLKQYMLGDAVDDNGIPWVSKVMDGNTADPTWNRQCLDLLEDVLKQERMYYVADSKVVNDPLVTRMMENGTMFLSRCPSNFNESLLEKTLMSFDLSKLEAIPNLSSQKKAATRRICGTTLEYKGRKLRGVLVETSTLAGKGEKAVKKAEEDFLNSLKSFQKDYNCKPDAEKAFSRFEKKHSKGIFDISAEYKHQIVEKRTPGRPRKDGTDIRRYDRWTVNVTFSLNPQRSEVLRRKKNHILLISNIPTPEEDAEAGMDDEGLVKCYGNQWRVERGFMGKKRPVMVERLFMKDPGRAAALITIVNIAALVRAVVQLLMRRGIDALSDEELPDLGRSGAKLQRNATYDYFMESCMNCRIRYDPYTNKCRFFNNFADKKASAYLSLMGIPKAKLFVGGV